MMQLFIDLTLICVGGIGGWALGHYLAERRNRNNIVKTVDDVTFVRRVYTDNTNVSKPTVDPEPSAEKPRGKSVRARNVQGRAAKTSKKV